MERIYRNENFFILYMQYIVKTTVYVCMLGTVSWRGWRTCP
ncbi:hypothetical protein HMPREF9445_01755 [Bacteroides clarus YIT 12056]|uniref:Uncharacterized protein n=1 Tax=Bacteroides clarus YIT 12056 TaxID=762984 RepID=A0ABN0CNF0_9BACE|nr:hypothetical protein HMPREF9445_01755 [Bacteroides clarus YIT 12056]